MPFGLDLVPGLADRVHDPTYQVQRCPDGDLELRRTAARDASPPTRLGDTA
jgi:hypothetical protein